MTALVDWVLDHRGSTLACVLVLLLAAAWPLSQLRIVGNYEVFFDSDDPRLTAFHQLESRFSSTDTVTFMVIAKQGDVFTPKIAAVIRELSRQAWDLPFVERVDSLASAVLVSSDPYGIAIDEVFPPDIELDSSLLADRRARALSDPLLLDNLVSVNGDVAAVHALVNAPGEAVDEPAQIMQGARQLVESLAGSDYEIRLTGLVAINNGFAEGALNDLLWLAPTMLVVMLLVAWLVLRSIAAVAAVVAAMTAAQWAGMGLATAFGIPLTPPSASGSSIIATLAVANSVHVIAAMQRLVAAGQDRSAAIAESLRENLQPITLTTVTTVVGFLALNSSSVPPYRFLGNTAALGITVSYVLTFTLLPALLSFWGVGQRREAGGVRFEQMANWVVARRGLLAIVVGLGSVVLAGLAFTNRVDDDFVTYFSERNPVRANAEFAMRHLGGVYTLHYAFETGEESGVLEGPVLAEIDAFARWAEQQPEVSKVLSIAPLLERIGEALDADPPLPTDRAAAAQYLLLYEMSLPPGQGLRDRLNVDRSATRVTVVMGEATNAEILAFSDRAHRWLTDNWSQEVIPQASGPIVLFLHLFREATFSTVRGLAVGALMIAFIIAWSLRSARLGALSLLPNAIPALMALGVWSLIDGRLNVAASSVAALSFGIIVDDTIHILTRYRRRRAAGESATGAMQHALTTVARPIVSTTLILTAGFLLLIFSDFGLNVTLGALTALTITLALALDFLALPGIVIATDSRGEESRST